MEPNYKTITDYLDHWALKKPDSIAFTYLDMRGIESSITFSSLKERSQALAGSLQKAHFSNKRALLLFPPGLDFISCFFGCIYADVIAVPYFFPRNNKKNAWEKVRNIIINCEASLVITDTKNRNKIDENLFSSSDNPTKLFSIDELTLSNCAYTEKKTLFTKNKTCFLQYTSGSTSSPKGVIVSHDNIIHNQTLIKEKFNHCETTVFANWLPHYHDMGLVGNIIHPVYLGIKCAFISPQHFLARPMDWLKLISDHKATTSGSPNFGYQHCVNQFDPAYLKKNKVSLKSWSNAYIGAEPILHSTLKDFFATYSAFGFANNALLPVYGMAETTLLASSSDHKDEPITFAFRQNRDTIDQFGISNSEPQTTLVSSGTIKKDDSVRIDPLWGNSCSTSSPTIGEILVSSESVCQGYWNSVSANANLFSNINGKTYLRTGDIGFIEKGNLYVSGRIKELIIVNGQNIYPFDIESLISDPKISTLNGTAAISISTDNQEKLLIVQEIRRDKLNTVDLNKRTQQIYKIIFSEYGFTPHKVVYVKPATLPKTSSGKLQRIAIKDLWLNNKLKNILNSDSDVPRRENERHQEKPC